MNDEYQHPYGKLWADNVARSMIMTKPAGAIESAALSKGQMELAKQAALMNNRSRVFNGAVNGGGALIYGEKLGQAKSKKEALDAILGIMVGGLPMAFESAATITPTAQNLKDWADVLKNGSKIVEY